MTAVIKDFMSTKVITIDPTDAVEKALELFQIHKIHHLPVVTEENKVVGIISSNDTCIQEKKATLTGEIMQSDVTYVNANASLKAAIDIFNDYNFHALPVIDDNEYLVGIITARDLIKILSGMIDLEIHA